MFAEANELPAKIVGQLRGHLWLENSRPSLTLLRDAVPTQLYIECCAKMREFLERCSLFTDGVSPNEAFLSAMIPEFDEHCFLPGDVVFQHGDVSNEMYFIRSGTLLEHFRRRTRLPSKVLQPSEHFGEEGLVLDMLRQSTVVADRSADNLAVLYVLQRSTLEKLLPVFPEQKRVYVAFKRRLIGTKLAKSAATEQRQMFSEHSQLTVAQFRDMLHQAGVALPLSEVRLICSENGLDPDMTFQLSAFLAVFSHNLERGQSVRSLTQSCSVELLDSSALPRAVSHLNLADIVTLARARNGLATDDASEPVHPPWHLALAVPSLSVPLSSCAADRLAWGRVCAVPARGYASRCHLR